MIFVSLIVLCLVLTKFNSDWHQSIVLYCIVCSHMLSYAKRRYCSADLLMRNNSSFQWKFAFPPTWLYFALLIDGNPEKLKTIISISITDYLFVTRVVMVSRVLRDSCDTVLFLRVITINGKPSQHRAKHYSNDSISSLYCIFLVLKYNQNTSHSKKLSYNRLFIKFVMKWDFN